MFELLLKVKFIIKTKTSKLSTIKKKYVIAFRNFVKLSV